MLSEHMLSIIGQISGVLTAISFVVYIVDIVRGYVQPHRMTWFIWFVLGCIALGSQWSAGAGDSLWMVSVATVGCLIVLLLSLRYGVGGTSRLDVTTFVLALLGLLLWWLTDQPVVAIVSVIVADALGGMLTFRKAWLQPDTETVGMWLLNAGAGLCATIAVGGWYWMLLLYPAYIMFFNISMLIVIYTGRMRKTTS